MIYVDKEEVDEDANVIVHIRIHSACCKEKFKVTYFPKSDTYLDHRTLQEPFQGMIASINLARKAYKLCT